MRSECFQTGLGLAGRAESFVHRRRPVAGDSCFPARAAFLPTDTMCMESASHHAVRLSGSIEKWTRVTPRCDLGAWPRFTFH